MAFCSNCGCEVSADEKFCHSCGTALNAVQVQNQSGNISSPNVNPREDSLKKITTYHDYFSQYEDGFRYYLYCQDLGNTPKRKSIGLKIVSIILLIYAILFLIESFALLIFGDTGFFTFSIIMSAIMFLVFLPLNKKVKNIKTAKNDLPVITENLEKCYAKFGDSSIGIQYVFPWILRDLYSYVQNGRADSIKEAINIYETELHNQTMKNLAAETAYNAKQAASYAKKAANYASASFWIK